MNELTLVLTDVELAAFLMIAEQGKDVDYEDTLAGPVWASLFTKMRDVSVQKLLVHVPTPVEEPPTTPPCRNCEHPHDGMFCFDEGCTCNEFR